jgi:DNA-binding LytR/AlgR family response regulator
MLEPLKRISAMRVIKTLIVDDEPIARRVLREELEQFDTIALVGEANDGLTALASIRELNPDLVFLDLEMPGLGGLEVIRRIEASERVPVIVIVTAWDQHAIQAFEAGAVDYLLKPVGQDRLAQAVERAAKICGRPAMAAEQLANLQEIAQNARPRPARRIVAKAGAEYLLLNADEVFAFEAQGDLVWIVTAKKRYLATQTLRQLQERLLHTSFRRIHRSALVNIDHIRKMSTLTSQRWLITLSNDQEFIVSKRQAREVRGLLTF